MPRVSGVQESQRWGSPGVPVVKTLCFHFRGCRFDPWSGNQDPMCHVVQPKGKKQKETNKQTCQGCSPSLILGGLLSWLGAGILVSSPSPDHPGVLSLVSLRSHCLLFQIFLSSPPGVSHPVVCSFVALSQIRSCYPV